MIYITNRAHSVNLPYEPGLLEWLQENYPYSGYQLIDYGVKQGETNEQ